MKHLLARLHLAPRWVPVAFLVVVLLQLAIPARMIWQHETTLRQGELFRFRVGQVDPIDPFRGRYLVLAVLPTTAPAAGEPWKLRGDVVYLPLLEDAEGFVLYGKASTQPPTEGPYLRAKARWTGGEEITIEAPFDRYYLREDLARGADRLLRGDDPTWVEVRVRDGQAVVESLMVDGRPIEEVVAAGSVP